MNMNPTYWNVFPKQPPVKYNSYKIKESRKSLLNLNLLKIILTFFFFVFLLCMETDLVEQQMQPEVKTKPNCHVKFPLSFPCVVNMNTLTALINL